MSVENPYGTLHKTPPYHAVADRSTTCEPHMSYIVDELLSYLYS